MGHCFHFRWKNQAEKGEATCQKSFSYEAVDPELYATLTLSQAALSLTKWQEHISVSPFSATFQRELSPFHANALGAYPPSVTALHVVAHRVTWLAIKRPGARAPLPGSPICSIWVGRAPGWLEAPQGMPTHSHVEDPASWGGEGGWPGSATNWNLFVQVLSHLWLQCSVNLNCKSKISFSNSLWLRTPRILN